MTRAAHLVRRFVSSIAARSPDAGDVAFVRAALTAEEYRCWERLGPADRSESVATGRAAARLLGPDADARWVAVALVHDVGKADTSLGPSGRAGATIVAALASHGRARTWSNAVGRYVSHDERGARLLQEAGARAEAVAWAGAHHRPDRWGATGIPPEICQVLAAADGERIPAELGRRSRR